MKNERFWKITSLNSSGNEVLRQAPLVRPPVPDPPTPWFAGQTIFPGKFDVRVVLFGMLTKPPGCGAEVVVPEVVLDGPCVLARGAPSVLKSMPEEAVESFDMMVLLMMLTFNASSSDTPPPSQPATLLTMMLLVTSGEYHGDMDVEIPGNLTVLLPFGKLMTSVPLTFWNARPPPLPLSAWLPMIRLALMTRLGPAPSLGRIEPGAGTQSTSIEPPQAGSASGAPMISRPPPLVAIVGLVLWLKRIALCSMSPLQL